MLRVLFIAAALAVTGCASATVADEKISMMDRAAIMTVANQLCGVKFSSDSIGAAVLFASGKYSGDVPTTLVAMLGRAEVVRANIIKRQQKGLLCEWADLTSADMRAKGAGS